MTSNRLWGWVAAECEEVGMSVSTSTSEAAGHCPAPSQVLVMSDRIMEREMVKVVWLGHCAEEGAEQEDEADLLSNPHLGHEL